MEMKLRELFELIGNDYISYNYLNGLVYEDMPNTLLNTYELISHRPFKLKGELANYKKKMDKFTDGSFSCDGVGVLVYYENLITKQWFIDEYQDMEDVKRFIINSLYDTSINHEFTTIIKSSKKVDITSIMMHVYGSTWKTKLYIMKDLLLTICQKVFIKT